MTVPAAAATLRPAATAQPAGEFPAVLAGTALTGAAARLAGLLDPLFLTEAGWDPVTRVLSLPAGHRLLGRAVCQVEGCTGTVRPECGQLCYHCFSTVTRQGLSADQIPRTPRSTGCAVPGCRCSTPTGRAVLCTLHSRQFRRMRAVSLERFVADPRVRPLPASGPCLAVACVRMADGGHRGYCAAHYQRWLTATRTDPELDVAAWQRTESAVALGGQVSLRGLPPLVVTGVLLGVQQRTSAGAKVTDVDLRAVCDTLRRRQVTAIEACPAELVAGKPARQLLRALAGHVRQALADPLSEQANDTWDLAVFGHPGRLTFTGISQPWLAQAAKRWAVDQLPRHRGKGVSNVRGKVNALARLSAVLRTRPDEGLVPAALGRADIDCFLNRLAYLESAGQISRYHRNVICRDTRAALAGIRALGLTRPGQAAAGLPGDVAVEYGDVPGPPDRGEPGRDLPPQIMAALCDNLQSLQPAEVRAAVQIGIDTGRRPEDILDLPADCLRHDKDGAPVLVYDNAKAGRLGRRLPINTATAAVITAQQDRVRTRFPHTPAGELKLLPSPRRNPDGRRPITIDMLEGRHREWVTALGPLRTADGAQFDPTRIVPYAYRHTYAQRHADAGVPIDVLAELLDHRNLNVTRQYYRIGEDRRRDAVDRVTALSFDRHGNRVWRDAQKLLESEHARYALGEVAVPYGTCTEPSNVQAGGGACPIRFRCAGCDHFRTDVSYLPDLSAYLDDLLRTRERLTAAIDGVDDWARVDATPTDEEITRIRRLITRIKGDLSKLTQSEQDSLHESITTIRRHRAVSLGIPTIRAATPTPEAPA
jgi:integrase